MSTVDPMKKSSIYSIFGKHYGNNLYRLLDDCCDGVGSFCHTVKECLGISSTGDESLVLNQRGEWVSNNGNIQTLLGELPVYQSEANALANGVAYGSWFFNTLNNTVSKAWNFIKSYTAGVSDIDFTNTTAGVDSWDILFKATPTSLQLGVGETIVDYAYDVELYQAGVKTILYQGNNTIDTLLNATLNGAGVYSLICTYYTSFGNSFVVRRLIKVDAVGNILNEVNLYGTTVNSFSGLNIDITASISLVNCTYPIQWVALDNTYTPTIFPQTGANVVLTLPSNTAHITPAIELDAIFNDMPAPANMGAIQSITII